ncbi:M20 aminoacylase family protein [Roseomonas xinghualingensis]|uniref:M20 aminoacylase family protein n=1 Tax=Roseomonas xinghualingensis TaxID=2986475 RepID=UPI0021F177D6|nr:M20 aminoacylase family protein [Roseomonas sp. SXEYE001]MCV4207175.1 M20 family metallopeptidase [Roseomonas sp. SXEYE001]
MHDLIDRLAARQDDLVAIRHDLHRHPEMGFEERRTAALVAGKLREWGIQVEEGVAGTGVVGTLKGRLPGQRAIALRADMDALPIHETTGLPHASIHPGVMHACGHDGHTTMLLGAARYLAENPNFAGIVHFIFQPAEEGLGGGRRMVEEGLFERFPADAVFGLHNEPGLALGRFGIRTGPMLANVDTWSVIFRGTGGHGAVPHRATDPTQPLAAFIGALQGVIGRNLPARETGVLSVGHIAAGDVRAPNVIPFQAQVSGTGRSFKPEVREIMGRRLRELAESLATAHGCTAEVEYRHDYPALVNTAGEVALAARAAGALAGAEMVDTDFPPITAGEDFAYMLQARPGAFMLVGNGVAEDGSFHHVHTPKFDFNDALIPVGAAYWVSLVAHALGDATDAAGNGKAGNGE